MAGMTQHSPSGGSHKSACITTPQFQAAQGREGGRGSEGGEGTGEWGRGRGRRRDTVSLREREKNKSLYGNPENSGSNPRPPSEYFASAKTTVILGLGPKSFRKSF